jgi:HSP20 family protein
MNEESNEISCTPNDCCATAPSGSAAVSHRVKPEYRVTRDEHAFTVRVFLPGVGKDAVNLSVDSHVLTIEAERNDRVEASWKPVFEERDRSGYLLQLKLSPEVDGENIKASVENGVLTLVLPVAEAAKPRSIPVD